MDDQIIKKLQQLSELLKSGALTQEEFNVAKQRLLGDSSTGTTGTSNQNVEANDNTVEEQENISVSRQITEGNSSPIDEKSPKKSSKLPYFIISILVVLAGLVIFNIFGVESYGDKRNRYLDEGKIIIEDFSRPYDSLSIMFVDTDGSIYLDNLDSVIRIYDGKDIIETSLILKFEDGKISLTENFQPTAYSSLDSICTDYYCNKLGEYGFSHNVFRENHLDMRIYMCSSPGNIWRLPGNCEASHMEDSILHFSIETELLWVGLVERMHDIIKKYNLPLTGAEVSSLFKVSANCEVNMCSRKFTVNDISIFSKQYLCSDFTEEEAFSIISQEFNNIANKKVQEKREFEAEQAAAQAAAEEERLIQSLAIDLGLSVKWAKCNIGADTPSEYGKYYAWGETKPKARYQWSNYKHNKAGHPASDELLKYCSHARYGIVDNKMVLEPEDDVATVTLGRYWRIPTEKEWEELIKKCYWTREKQFGHEGFKVRGPNGNSIFLPFAGVGSDYEVVGKEKNGYYWSSTRESSSNTAAKFEIDFDRDYPIMWYEYRAAGLTIRPVCVK